MPTVFLFAVLGVVSEKKIH